jgi:RNA polymerase sigma-70 factor, ECF subfamily
MPDPQMPLLRANDRNSDTSHRSDTADGDGFDRAVAKYHERIRLFVYRLLGWREEVEDVVQDIFLAALSGWSRCRDKENAELWLKRIAVNKCRSRLRREMVRQRWFGWIRRSYNNQPHTDAANVLEKQEQAGQIRAAIQNLEPAYREVTILHYLEHMNIDEISDVLDVRRNTVEVRLHRARQQLEKKLADMME